MNKQGKLVLFSGPSGVGKDTLLDVLLLKNPNFQKSISMTTRAQRAGETDGKDYYFTTEAHFKSLIENGEMLEFAQYGQHLYGTPKAPVDGWLQDGKIVILKIEVQGAEKIKALYPDALSLFIMPPSMEILEDRLRNRGTEDEDDLNRRLDIAKREIEKSQGYDYIIVNDRLEEAVDEVLGLLNQ